MKHEDGERSRYATITGETTELHDNFWYVVSGNVTVNERITVSGAANLILKDGATLIASQGIDVYGISTLNIFAQTNGTGAIIATGSEDAADIGGGTTACGGTISIYGGTVSANGSGDAAGIGSGADANGSFYGEITINNVKKLIASGGRALGSAAGQTQSAERITLGDELTFGAGTDADSITVTNENGSLADALELQYFKAPYHQHHTEVIDKGKAATCTEDGLTEGKHCSVCNEVLVKQETVKALGHNFVGNTCTICGYTESSGGGSSEVYFTLNFNINGGSVISSVSGTYGKVIDLSKYVPAKDGYTFNGWYSDSAMTVPVKEIALNGDKTVYAKWVEQSPVSRVFPFTDVASSAWSYRDIYFVWEKGMMNGVSKTLFAPKLTTSRAMIVTILWRLDGEPTMMNANIFEDVVSGSYCEKAIVWAQGKGIVQGYGNGKFGSNDPITREQMAAILCRYAQYKGHDVSVDENTNFLSYNDFRNIREYAMAAMMWAIENGLIRGNAGYLLPAGNATREQVAAILHRFCEKL